MRRCVMVAAMVLLVCIGLTGIGNAGPFLTCDDMQGVDGFIMELDGKEYPVSPAVNGHAWVDMEFVSIGFHTVRLKAVNMWGVGPFSDPFDFEKYVPGKPFGTGFKAK